MCTPNTYLEFFIQSFCINLILKTIILLLILGYHLALHPTSQHSVDRSQYLRRSLKCTEEFILLFKLQKHRNWLQKEF